LGTYKFNGIVADFYWKGGRTQGAIIHDVFFRTFWGPFFLVVFLENMPLVLEFTNMAGGQNGDGMT